jgi:putative redox protein
VKAVDIGWRSGTDRFDVRGGNGVVVHLAAPRFDEAAPPAGPGPAEMLLAAAGSCSAWDVVEILHKQRQSVSAIDVHVEGEQDEDPPWPFRRIVVRFVVRGRALDAAKVARAVQLSESRYCSVIATVRGTADVVVISETVEDPAG